ncbi:ABC transporter ATP-binding protein [Umezawaea endophytica]|uniref:ABC transporter ATP-binding protein/permease n=1 Tax=Umezawaea endophytica TaxID=1654476 RepID=A0A9X2VUL7_9PSEU|nr:ABC transporter ATP-binding protein [Umezawaea endophytica]MCS7483123.1 ABC transporter ATP-binding protein/permease [Umezawaea endophytica]
MLSRILGTYLRPHRASIALLILLQMVQTVTFLLLPTMNAQLIDRGLLRGSIVDILWIGAVMVGVAAVQVAARMGAQYFGTGVATALGAALRSAIFRRVQDFSVHEVERFGAASLTTRTVNDVQQIQLVTVDGFGSIVSAPIMCVASIVLALQQDVPLTLVLLVFIPLATITVLVVMARMSPLYSLIQHSVDRMNRLLREQITGVRVIRAFVREDHERRRFGDANEELFQLTMRARRQAAMMFPIVWLLGNVFTVVVVWVGGSRIGSGDLTIGALSAFTGYVILILTSMLIAMYVFLTVPRAQVAARRVCEVLDTPASPSVDGAGDGGTGALPGHVDLRGAGFRYPGAEEPSLRDITLSVRPGETLALIGSTGSGKTTLLNLVLRLYETTTGSVLVNGTDVREVDRDALSATVGLVSQKPYLFAGTIATNLRYGRPEATDDELWHALDVAQVRDFVAGLPDGLDSAVVQGGGNFSGGQRQRLSIARTLVRRPDVYLFDDCFSGLDYATEAALRAALAPDIAGATVIVVAQRISTIRDADRIAVLDEGRVVGLGTHDELIAGNDVYRAIAQSQLTAQEAL